MNKKATLVASIVTIVYMVIGGAIFKALEGHHETSTRANLTQLFTTFLYENPCVDRQDLIRLFQPILEAYRAGILVVGNSTKEANWDLYNSIFFSLTVITTIGYGNVAPITLGGRSFCVFYAIVGIPLMLLTLAGIGEQINHLTNAIRRKGFSRICSCCTSKWQKIIGTVISTIIGLILFFFIPAVIFWAMEENWTYRDATYYCFITLLTIGFGDVVAGWPADDRYAHRAWYRLLIGGWILVGLSWVSGIINTFLELYQSIISKTEGISTKNENNTTSVNKDQNSENLDGDSAPQIPNMDGTVSIKPEHCISESIKL